MQYIYYMSVYRLQMLDGLLLTLWHIGIHTHIWKNCMSYYDSMNCYRISFWSKWHACSAALSCAHKSYDIASMPIDSRVCGFLVFNAKGVDLQAFMMGACILAALRTRFLPIL